ncbi:MAG: RHS repeat protein [Pirellulaceae bacterium]|nr:RHS repeat protein [Pirellulaceae bacterium]
MFGEVVETRSVDADGYTTRSLTDGAGRTLQTIDQLEKFSTMTYDAAGNVLSVRDPNGRVRYLHDCTLVHGVNGYVAVHGVNVR